MGVYAGQFQQWKQITYEVINDILATEVYSIHEEKLYSCMYGSPHPGTSQQQAAHVRPHDGHVVKGLTDGLLVVIGHHNEKNDSHPTKAVLSE